MPSHEDFMRLAIDLAREARERGDGPFGAVLVHRGEVVLTEGNRVRTCSDPTWHAELALVRAFCSQHGVTDLCEYTLYSSCEPCCMCAGSLVWARLGTLVYSVSGEQLAGLSPHVIELPCADVFAHAPHAPRVVAGVLVQEGLRVFSGYRFDSPA